MSAIHRGYSAVRSAIVMLRLWRLMSWHDKMWILWADESITAEQRKAFAADIVRSAALALFDKADMK